MPTVAERAREIAEALGVQPKDVWRVERMMRTPTYPREMALWGETPCPS